MENQWKEFKHLTDDCDFKFPKELGELTADLWLANKTIKITELGSENTYYEDGFGLTFYCKNYPQ